MDWTQMLSDIFRVCIIPLLGVLTTYVVKHIQIKSLEITEKLDHEIGAKYVEMLTKTIESCVIATNQTYVDALKKAGSFDAEAQKMAFTMTKQAVLTILSDDAKIYLEEAFGDLNEYITKQIEASVNINKK